jgi:hypothetical protein
VQQFPIPIPICNEETMISNQVKPGAQVSLDQCAQKTSDNSSTFMSAKESNKNCNNSKEQKTKGLPVQ